jgi:glutamate-1-semialdehyde 2,1-aminomutase
MEGVLRKWGKPYVINRFGSMFSIHFSDKPVNDFASAAACDIPLFNQFFHSMLSQGIYLPPSGYESWFISNSLTKADIDKTVEAAARFFGV